VCTCDTEEQVLSLPEIASRLQREPCYFITTCDGSLTNEQLHLELNRSANEMQVYLDVPSNITVSDVRIKVL
jgi:hypothetical protein